MKIGAKIKAIRKRHGMTQAQLAEEIGVDRTHVTKIETGKANPSPQLLKSVALRYDLPESWLVDDNDPTALWSSKLRGLVGQHTNEHRFRVLNELLGAIGLELADCSLRIIKMFEACSQESGVDIFELTASDEAIPISIDHPAAKTFDERAVVLASALCNLDGHVTAIVDKIVFEYPEEGPEE